MPNAKKYKNQWRCQVYIGKVDGKNQYKSFYATTKREAEVKATQYAQTHKASAKITATFSEYALNYINKRTNVLSPASIRKYENHLKALNKYEWFATKQVSRITYDDMQTLANELAIKYAPKTVQTMYGFAITVLKKVNDFDKVNLPRVDDTPIEIPTDAEIEKLMDIVKGTCMEIPCMLGAYCMLRRAEISALTIDDFDFDKCELRINKDMVKDSNGKWLVKPPKTSSSIRTIPIPKEVAEIVKTKGSVTNLNPDKITRFFGQYIKKLNMPSYHFHCLRHYCCSVFCLTAPLLYVKAYGGWGKDSNVCERIYAHVKRDNSDAIYANALSYFSKSTDTNTDTGNKKVAQT